MANTRVEATGTVTIRQTRTGVYEILVGGVIVARDVGGTVLRPALEAVRQDNPPIPDPDPET